MEFFDTIQQIQTNWEPYKKWDIDHQKREKQTEELRQKYPPTPQEINNAKQYGRTIIDAINTMDQHSIDKSEDANLAFGFQTLPLDVAAAGIGIFLGNLISKNIKNPKFKDIKPYGGLIGFIITSTIYSPIIQIWQSKIMKQASRVARFQTRENELKDSRNFVIYSDGQIKEAEKIAKTLPDVKEERKDKFTSETFNPYQSYKKAKNTTDLLNKDDAKYKEWKKAYLIEEEKKKEWFKKLNPTREELNKAEKDRDSILNTITSIETKSLNYLNNMEMASYLIRTAVCSSFMIVGVGLTKLLDFAIKENKKLGVIKALPLILSSIAPIFILSPITKLIKDAARIGRFKAKQELLNNPESFISYDNEQRKNVPLKDLPEQKNKSFIERLKEDLIALKQLQQDSKEYNEYMENEHKAELKLKEALKRVKISDKQKKEALILQKNSFHAFEKMDEKAQRFTDDSDAAVDSFKVVSFGIIGLSFKLLSLFLCGKEIKKVNGNKMPDTFTESMKLTFTKALNGKTAFAIMLPFLIPPFIKIALTAKGVQIKKDAGKIGIMTATQDLSDPKNFLDEKEKNNFL